MTYLSYSSSLHAPLLGVDKEYLEPPTPRSLREIGRRNEFWQLHVIDHHRGVLVTTALRKAEKPGHGERVP
jgi:hypothetical protein